MTMAAASTLKSLGLILDQQLTFDDYATMQPSPANVRPVRYLLIESVARR